MKIAIVTNAVYENEPGYVKATDQLKELYCGKFGYTYLKTSNNPHPEMTGHWSKFRALLEALDGGYDWVVWMDCDAAPARLDYDIADVLGGLDGTRVVIRRDILGWNSGVFAVPNTETMRRWLEWLDSEDTRKVFDNMPFKDQDAIAHSLGYAGVFTNRWYEPPEEVGWNQFDGIYKWYYPNRIPNKFVEGKSWCLHIAGYSDQHREWRFRSILDKLTSCQCPCCGANGVEYATVPFDKTYSGKADGLTPNAEHRTATYHICPECGYVFLPLVKDWTPEDYARHIYNDEFDAIVDTEHKGGERDRSNFALCRQFLSVRTPRVLDYGGGHGGFAKLLGEKKMWCDTYDAFYGSSPDVFVNDYSLVTCFETLEHIYDPKPVFRKWNECLLRDGCVIITTQLHDTVPECKVKPPEKWPYLCPRNGHVSMHSTDSIRVLANRFGFHYDETNSNFFTQVLVKRRGLE